MGCSVTPYIFSVRLLNVCVCVCARDGWLYSSKAGGCPLCASCSTILHSGVCFECAAQTSFFSNVNIQVSTRRRGHTCRPQFIVPDGSKTFPRCDMQLRLHTCPCVHHGGRDWRARAIDPLQSAVHSERLGSRGRKERCLLCAGSAIAAVGGLKWPLLGGCSLPPPTSTSTFGTHLQMVKTTIRVTCCGAHGQFPATPGKSKKVTCVFQFQRIDTAACSACCEFTAVEKACCVMQEKAKNLRRADKNDPVPAPTLQVCATHETYSKVA